MLKMIDNMGNVTTIEYDRLGRRTSINNPDTGEVTYEYDPAGNLSGKVTPNLRKKGAKIRYNYDFNRLTSMDYPASGRVTYAYGSAGAGYNQAGRITGIESGDFKETRRYGKLGEVVESTRSIRREVPDAGWSSYTTRYEFDSMGRMRKLTFPDGEALTYTYDGGGQLKSAAGSDKNGSQEYVRSMLYNEFGDRAEVTTGDGAVSAYTYDAVTRRLNNLKTTLGGAQVQNINYTYDAEGNIKDKSNTDCAYSGTAKSSTTQRYGYDRLNRLTSSRGTYKDGIGTINEYTDEFSYDTIGNMTGKTQTNTLGGTGGDGVKADTTYTYNYSYGARPHAVTSTGTITYGYDDNGNMTSWNDTETGASRTLAWDDDNRLTQTVDALGTARFRYDSSGTRIAKNGSSGEVLYVNDNYSVRNGNLVSKHVFAGNTRAASKLVMDGTDTGTYYYHGDHLDSSNVISDGAGKVQEHTENFPYGETWVSEKPGGGNSLPFKFTSKELDPETGLYYFGARYYDARLSRWISTDPALERYLPGKNGDRNLPAGGVYNSGNLGLYSYCANDPVNYSDPDGNMFYPWHFLISFSAAYSVGFDLPTSAVIGWNAMAWDWKTGSQSKDDSYMVNSHSLIYYDGKTPQSLNESKVGAQNFIDAQLSRGTLEGAGYSTHTSVDRNTFMHAGHTFDGFLDWQMLPHAVDDFFPTPVETVAGFMDARNVLSEYRSMNGGNNELTYNMNMNFLSMDSIYYNNFSYAFTPNCSVMFYCNEVNWNYGEINLDW